MPTDFGFTGQRRDTSAGLLFYNARYYDATLGRFVNADTIVPSAGKPQALNRYAYGLNNPVRYTDPSGHCNKDDPLDDQACWDTFGEIKDRYGLNPVGLDDWNTRDLKGLLGWLNAGIRFTSVSNEHGLGATWTTSNLRDVMSALERTKSIVGNGMARIIGDGLTINKLHAACENAGCISGWGAPGAIDMYLGNEHNIYATQTAVHELGHIVDWVARPASSANGFSYSPDWAGRVGWTYIVTHPYAHSLSEILRDITEGNWQPGADVFVSDYARKNPGEDFAETFAWYVGANTGGGFNFVRQPGLLHQAALDVALGNAR